MGSPPTVPMFVRIALSGPADYFAAAVPADELQSRFETLKAETAREFFLLRTLAEVQKFGFALQRWSAEHAEASKQDLLREIRIESLALEKSAWTRRLLEALVTLICFEKTNDNAYFLHYMALAEYERGRRAVAEEKDFFGHVSDSSRDRMEQSRLRLDLALAALPDPAACWYVDRREPPRLCALKDRYLLAIRLAEPAERRALGYTYEASFGAASERLHFSVESGSPTWASIDSVAMSFCGLLTISILARAHSLSGVRPRGINTGLFASSARGALPLLPVAGKAAVGDFVLIEGPDVAEVIEVATSRIGYDSYRVELLSGARTGTIVTVPAPCMSVFMRKSELIADLGPLIANGVGTGSPLSELEVTEALRKAVQATWTYAGPALVRSGVDTRGEFEDIGQKRGT